MLAKLLFFSASFINSAYKSAIFLRHEKELTPHFLSTFSPNSSIVIEAWMFLSLLSNRAILRQIKLIFLKSSLLNNFFSFSMSSIRFALKTKEEELSKLYFFIILKISFLITSKLYFACFDNKNELIIVVST